MRTLQQFAAKPETIPASTSWYLADLGEARGKQELFTKQSPQRLKVLREHALIESAVSSNRIEGVRVDQSRIGTVLFGKSLLKDRDEEEVRGYRDALKLVHERDGKLPVSERTIKQLHRLTRGDIRDAGKYKDTDSDIIEKYPDGRERVRFKAVAAAKTEAFMRELVELWNRSLAWSDSSKRTKNATTRRWSRVPRAGTRENITHGLTLTISFSFSNPPTKSSKSGSDKLPRPKAQRRS